jgi:hypothetical protein
LTSPSLRFLAALAITALLIACGGGGDSGSGQLRFDPADADALAHAGLISAADLPGSGWQVTADDEREVDEQSPETDSCKQIKAFQDDVKADDAKSRAGRAQREIMRNAAGAGLPTGVEIEIEIYRDPALTREHLRRATSLVNNGAYSKCLTELLAEVYRGAGLSGTTKIVDGSAAPPANGFSFAAEGEVGGLPSALRFENYGWVDGNAKVRLTFSGAKSELTGDLVKTAIAKTQAALASAADAN